MKHFISVVFPDRKVKRSVLEHMVQASGLPLNESKLDYGIFESDNKGLVIKVALPRSLSEHESDQFADKISQKLFDMGYKDFDIESSVSLLDEASFNGQIELGQGPGNVKRGPDVDTALPYIDAEFTNKQGKLVQVRVFGPADRLNKFIQFKKPKIMSSGNGFNAPASAPSNAPQTSAELDADSKDNATKTTTPTGPKSIEQIVDTYAKPGMTLSDLQKMESELRAAEPQDLPKDQTSGVAGFFKKLGRGISKLTSTEDYRVRTGFAAAAWKLRLPGLYNSKGNFIYMGNDGQPQSAAGASLNQMLPLAKAGLLTDEKVAKTVKNFEYKTKNIQPGDVEARKLADKLDAIVAAHEGAKAKASTQADTTTPAGGDKAPQTSAELDADSKDNSTPEKSGNEFAGMNPAQARKAVEERITKLMDLLDNLGESNVYTQLMTMLVEGPQEDAEIYKLVKEIEQLLPLMGDDFKPYARMVTAQIKRAAAAVGRHEKTLAKPSADSTDTTDSGAETTPVTGGELPKPTELPPAGEKPEGEKSRSVSLPSLEKFAKSGKGGLKNDPDEKEAIKELQQRLADMGYDPGPVDGIYGRKTREAVKQFQKDYGLKVDGDAGPNTIAELTYKKDKTIYYPGDPIDEQGQKDLEAVGRDKGIIGEKLTKEDVDALNKGITNGTIEPRQSGWEANVKKPSGEQPDDQTADEPKVDTDSADYIGLAPKEEQTVKGAVVFKNKGTTLYFFKHPNKEEFWAFLVEDPGQDDKAQFKITPDSKFYSEIESMAKENSKDTGSSDGIKTGDMPPDEKSKSGGDSTGTKEGFREYTDMGQAMTDQEGLNEGDTVKISGEEFTVKASPEGFETKFYFEPNTDEGKKLLDDEADKILGDLDKELGE